jgi:dTMP kinase
MADGPRGRFIVIEGIDGSGTTLQTRAVTTWLGDRGHHVLETREPSTGAIGALARQRLAVHADADPATLALLFAADRLDHVAREVGPALAAGAVVVSDRYLLSSLAYQGLECDEAWVRQINCQAPRPDLTLVLDVPADVAFARVQRRTAAGASVAERFDALELQRRLAGHYRRLHDDPDLGPMLVVDGDRPPEAVTEALTQALMRAGL